MTPQAQRNLALAEMAEGERLKVLVNLEEDQPLVRFVSNEAQKALPDVLDMAPERGQFSLNGAEIPAEAAHAMAKALRKAVKEQACSSVSKGWRTTVIKS